MSVHALRSGHLIAWNFPKSTPTYCWNKTSVGSRTTSEYRLPISAGSFRCCFMHATVHVAGVSVLFGCPVFFAGIGCRITCETPYMHRVETLPNAAFMLGLPTFAGRLFQTDETPLGLQKFRNKTGKGIAHLVSQRHIVARPLCDTQDESSQLKVS